MNARDVALLSIETRLRRHIEDTVTAIGPRVGVAVAQAINTDPPLSGVELFSRQQVHTALTGSLADARASVGATVATGYAAAAHLARIHTTRALAGLGHTSPATVATGSDAVLAAISADLDTAFGHAQSDIANTVSTAYDGVTGTAAAPARVLTTNAALREPLRRLDLRVQAAATTAAYRGARDTELALYAQYAAAHPNLPIRKTWRVGAADPCPMCDALDGSTVNLDTEFDHTASTDETKLRPVWRDLQGPPRHPHCRCRLELSTSTDR